MEIRKAILSQPMADRTEEEFNEKFTEVSDNG